jgi:hypothetical protein
MNNERNMQLEVLSCGYHFLLVGVVMVYQAYIFFMFTCTEFQFCCKLSCPCLDPAMPSFMMRLLNTDSWPSLFFCLKLAEWKGSVVRMS